jgi:formylglycine-generating enzyme
MNPRAAARVSALAVVAATVGCILVTGTDFDEYYLAPQDAHGGSSPVDASAGKGGDGSVAGAGGFGGQDATDGNVGDAAGGGSGAAGRAGAAGGSGSAGAQDGGADGSSGKLFGCPTTGGGPTMVRIPGEYCVDSTEVTRSQYKAWLHTNPIAVDLPSPACKGKVTDGGPNPFTPDPVCMTHAAVCQEADAATGECSNHPQVCVDWCDAYAYCKAMGKRLCGKIGGGANDFDDHADATKSQWDNACSSGGRREYPYGDNYQAQTCNGYDNKPSGCKHGGDCETRPVGSLGGCQSPSRGYAGVYDLSGNVWEWEDSCRGQDANDACRQRGGSLASSEDSLRCGYNDTNAYLRNEVRPVTGFRCCSSP